MTLSKLLIIVALLALILTALNLFVLKKNKHVLITFFQNFAGVLFIISGYVKAVDPLGTAYKMEDYFAEFETTFADTFFNFLAPVFPALSEISIVFSVFMIVLEIVLGVMLLIGYQRKLTSWLFMIIILFFAFLTGFTYLTGYVPGDTNFFEFSKWGPYVKSNMKVTDCGCFGDFLKLEPKVSFLKDVFLLIPALVFVLFWRQMFQLTDSRRGFTLTAVATIVITFFCMRNFLWDLPVQDFRPFKIGTDIAERKKLEEQAMANAPVTYPLVNKKTGEKVKLSSVELTKNYKDYPKSEWEYLDQEIGKPSVPTTKISEFQVADIEGNDVTEEILSHKGRSIMIVNYKLNGVVDQETVTVRDTVYQIDTIQSQDNEDQIVRRDPEIIEKEETVNIYTWDKSYQLPFINTVVPFARLAKDAGIKVYSITKFYDPEKIEDFLKTIQADFPMYTADDILLKTIVRSNPGILYLEDATIIDKWHHKQLPDFDKFKEKYID
jgi:uncharacterized membrane protein YphA (DoxX/SURF4 family)